MIAAVQQQVAHTPDPRAQELLEYIKTPESFTLLAVIAMVAIAVAFLVLSTVGGVIATAVQRRRQRF